MKYPIGMKWGQFKVVDAGWEQKQTSPGVSEPVDYVVLRCVCGQEMRMDAIEVDKRVLKSCPACKAADNANDAPKTKTNVRRSVGRPRLTAAQDRKISCGISLPVRLINELQAEADQRKMPLSHVVLERLNLSYRIQKSIVESTNVEKESTNSQK